jgi:hypothetical protein
MAGLLSLLTSVLLHASPACTSGDASASARQLPDNFAEAARLVLESLNNVCSADLLAAQQMLASAHHRLEFYHLVCFMLAWCTEQWPHAGSSGGGGGADGGGGAGGGDARQAAAQPAEPEQQSRQGRAQGTPAGPPCAGTAAPAGASIAPSACIAQGALEALLDELLLLVGYFAVGNPSNQVGLDWDSVNIAPDLLPHTRTFCASRRLVGFVCVLRKPADSSRHPKTRPAARRPRTPSAAPLRHPTGHAAVGGGLARAAALPGPIALPVRPLTPRHRGADADRGLRPSGARVRPG